MKKILTFLFIGILACVAWSCSDNDNNDDIVISEKDLPTSAKSFISSYYPDCKIAKVELDVEHAGAKYDVKLSNGAEVEFDQTGNWIAVDAPAMGSVPAGIVPAEIASYVETNYQGTSITEISKETYGYEIELSNGVEVKFSPDFKALGIDM